MFHNPLEILQQFRDEKKGIIIHRNVLRALESGMESAFIMNAL